MIETTNTFKDKKGDEWTIDLTVGMLEDLKAHQIDIELLFKDVNKFMDLFLAKPEKLGELFYLVCEDQVKERGISPIDFAKRLNRETIDNATDALLVAALSFSQRGAVGKALRAKVPQMLRDLDDRIETEVTKRLSSNSHTNTPDSLESIPAG